MLTVTAYSTHTGFHISNGNIVLNDFYVLCLQDRFMLIL